ncbi:MAG: MG2 domain-containing protein, partial [Gammaproteobacteria bacterium]
MTPADFSRLVFALLFASFAAAAGGNLKILNVHPSGEDVPASRQIVFRFDRPVVAIGRMDRKKEEIPITVSPALDCQWRWLDRTSLACQLGEKEAMRKATRYSVTVWPGIETRERETTARPYVHEFVTERPQVRNVGFKIWRSPGVPVLRITFNQAVGRDSVERHVYLEAPSKKDAAERIAVKAEADPDDYIPPRFIAPPGENVLLDFGAQQGEKADDEAVVRSGVEARRVWLLTPEVELPLDSTVALKTEPGLVSAFGKERGARQKTELVFDTFPEFSFIGVACYGNDGSKLLITAANFESAGKCNPLKSVALNFSSPVLNSEIRDKTEITPDLAGGRKDYDPWANRRDYSSLGLPHKKGRSYNVYLPETLKAAELYGVFMKEGETVNDEFGRAPTAAPDMLFWTDHRKPDFVRAYRNSVLEGRIASEAPLYVTNLEKVLLNYKTLTPGGAEAGKSSVLNVPGAKDISFALPMRIRRMLDGSSGAVYGSIDSIPPVAKGAGERAFFSQVTPYQLHVKLGHFNTLVWVTDLASGEPVADAKVSIYKDAVALLSPGKAVLSAGTTGPGGTVVLDGVEKLDPQLETFGWRCSRDDCERLFVKVEKNGQMALIPLNHDFEVDAYRASGYTVYARQQKEFGHIRSWGTTAQGVYRPGDTMQYKLYVRNQNNTAFVPPPRQGYRLEIIDPSGKTVHRVEKVELNEFGGFHGDYRIPETALAGWHRFRLTAGFTKYDWQPMKVLVSDFTPAPFKVDSELNGDLFHPGDTLEIQTQARLHSGGAYTDARARVTVELKAGRFRSEHPLAADFLFSSSSDANERQLIQKTVPLNDKGEGGLTLTLPDADIVYGRLRVESGVQDDRGKTVAALSAADYFGVDRLVGLKNTRWLYREDEEAEIRYLVVDSEGIPAAGTKVEIRIRREETVAAKVKGAGNAYVTQFNTAWVDAGECRGVSAKEPLTCSFTPDRPGTFKVSAEIGDARGKRHISELTLWVAGKGRVIWRQPDDNSLQILPEKTEYSVGATARYLIKNPYPGAYALMTLERYGVIRQWVEKLEGSTPVVEFSVDRDLLPGFYFSAVVVSPRVEAPPPEEGQVDLGKPAFKIGYLEVPVRDPWKKIEVKVTTDAEVYKPRGKVRAELKARVENPESSEPIELAVAVLDEAVLDLVAGGRDHFDPYLGFYSLEGLDLRNYSLLTRLLGRQKFEKKGANSGGDGG